MISQKQYSQDDAFRTCLACILEEHVLQIPNFDKIEQANDWLVKNHKSELFGIFFEKYNDLDKLSYTLNGHHVIVTGPSFRNERHAIICRVDAGELTMIHDPHPDNTGLKLNGSCYYIYVFVRKQC